jgi:hypothetical protein
MAFETGNSGNNLYEAVVKIGTECAQEGAYCQYLGMNIAPVVFGLLPNGYVMERLKPAPRRKNLLIEIYNLLEAEVWSRPALPSSVEYDWRDHLGAFGIEIPEYAISKEMCLVHGDPTASNAMLRGDKLIIGDPRPPRAYMPQFRETDIGRILQSKLGWEVVAYGAMPVDFFEPEMDRLTRTRAIFWCGAAATRILHLERSRENPRQDIIDWCINTRIICGL